MTPLIQTLTAYARTFTEEALERGLRHFIIIFYAVGAAGLSLPATHDFFITLIAPSILLSFALLLSRHRSWSLRFLAVILLIAILGYSVEVIGVQTGWIFGSYTYGPALGPKWMQTPLLIGINWSMVVYCVAALPEPTALPARVFVPAGGLLLTLYDVFLERVAMATGMWSWSGGIPPVHNYLGWFLIGSTLVWILRRSGVELTNRLATTLLLTQIGFFASLSLIFRILGV